MAAILQGCISEFQVTDIEIEDDFLKICRNRKYLNILENPFIRKNLKFYLCILHTTKSMFYLMIKLFKETCLDRSKKV